MAFRFGPNRKDFFISVWRTTTPNESISLPLISTGNYSFYVYWGDGTHNTISSWNQAEVTHYYTNPGYYTVMIFGIINGFNFLYGNANSKNKIIEILQWGKLKLGNEAGYFSFCANLTLLNVSDIPDLSETTNLTQMFIECNSITTINRLNEWDVSNITNMSGMFYRTHLFNQNIDLIIHPI